MAEIAAQIHSSAGQSSMGEAVLEKWDRDHSWHPFTQMAEYLRQEPAHVEKGEGCWLYDTAGRRYLDGNASVWTNVHGHNDPDLNEALREQASRLAHSTYLGLSHPAGAELGSTLCRQAPDGLSRAIFSDNGSNAVEIALKLSFQYWQLVGQASKRLVVGMESGYHGDTFGTMSVGDSGNFHRRFDPWKFEARRFPAPICREAGGQVVSEESAASLAALGAILDREGGNVAAVILEPWVQGAAGMRFQPRGYLREVERLCRVHNVHLILDEVFVAFGRMGVMFVCQEEGVRPDFLCLAKGLSGGYLPLAATLTTEAVFEAFLGDFESGRAFYHGHTFAANPLAAAVSLCSIRKLNAMIASGQVARTAQVFGERLLSAFGNHPCVAELRQRGLAAALDLRPRRNGDAAWRPNDRMGMQVCMAARRQGLLLRPLQDSVLIVPPIVIASEEIEFLCQALILAIDEAIK